MLGGLVLPRDPNLIAGLGDDGGVLRLRDDLALIQTIDFFTPIVDDPVLFGRIAAANALSDVYAMGGAPLCAMNVACFPRKKLDLGVLRAAIEGALQKLEEAGTTLVGGHTVDNPEFLFGLSVTGLVHPEKVWKKQGIQAGDGLVLTKPLGTGVIATALKAGRADPASVEAAALSMECLNRGAAEILRGYPVHACTDVTGFGLAGHLAEMITDVGVTILAPKLPLLKGALALARLGLLPGGLQRNRAHRPIAVEGDVEPALQDLVFDPQTSGGLLAALPAAEADNCAARLRSAGLTAAVIAHADTPGSIRLLG